MLMAPSSFQNPKNFRVDRTEICKAKKFIFVILKNKLLLLLPLEWHTSINVMNLQERFDIFSKVSGRQLKPFNVFKCVLHQILQ